MKDIRINIVKQEINAKISPQSVDLSVGEVHSIYENDYEKIINKPKINGSELSGDNSSAKLSLLDSRTKTYPLNTLENARKNNNSIILMNANGNTLLPFDELLKGRIETKDRFDIKSQVGDYIFKEIKGV